MDEIGLFWRCLPRKTFPTSDESAPSGIKDDENRVTILLCSNAAGTLKCKQLVMGKSAQSYALKGLKTLHVIYKSNRRSWGTNGCAVQTVSDI